MSNHRNNRHHSMWDELMNPVFYTGDRVSARAASPAINLYETEEAYEAQIAAPGLAKDDFTLTFDEEGSLVVRANKQAAAADPALHERYLRREFAYGKFSKAFVLPDDVDRDAVTARAADGILTITFPKLKPQAAAPRTITVE